MRLNAFQWAGLWLFALTAVLWLSVYMEAREEERLRRDVDAAREDRIGSHW